MVSFELRRAHADLILCFKIVHGFLNINMTDFFEFEHNTVIRGHQWRLRALKPLLESRRHLFAYRTVIIWNKLSEETVRANSLSSFRAKLIHEDLSRFLKICL